MLFHRKETFNSKTEDKIIVADVLLQGHASSGWGITITVRSIKLDIRVTAEHRSVSLAEPESVKLNSAIDGHVWRQNSRPLNLVSESLFVSENRYMVD